MLWTLARRSAAAAVTSSGVSTVPPALDPILSRALQKLLPKNLPPSLVIKPGNLYEVLSRTPSGGVGTEVHQIRWNYKAIADSFWLVTRTRFKCEGKHGRAWGMLYWKGKLVSPREERIRGSLKHTWTEGRSQPMVMGKRKAKPSEPPSN